MLSEPIASLIRAEQARQGGRFVKGVDLEVYLTKLGQRAEILSDAGEGRCRGFVAFYANDQVTKRAFITLVLVNPSDRGLGIGRALTTCVLDLARRRGFTSCRLEVARDNAAAQAVYRALGFRVIEGLMDKDLMEVAL